MSALETLGQILTKLFKSSSERYVKKRHQFVEDLLRSEETYQQLTDAELRAKTDQFRVQVRKRQDELLGEPLRDRLNHIRTLPDEARRPAKRQLADQMAQSCEEILSDAFATIREASDRHLGVRNAFDASLDFDVDCLSPETREFYEATKQRVVDGANVHELEIPPKFYAEVRARYDSNDRPPFRFRHFDVQMIGGSVLYEGTIAEMATGEGKTLVATLAAYVVAVSGLHVHVITVNDYLAQRDRDWMAPVFEALGLTVGAIQSHMDTVGDERRQQYGCDITYGTNNEFGFDYLRDNMKMAAEQQVQGPLDYTIIDEVDEILIDEARTPLIISGPAQDDTRRYAQADTIARELLRKQDKYMQIEQQIDQLKRDVASAEGDLGEARKNKETDAIKKAEAAIKQNADQQAELEDKLTRTTQFFEVERDRRSVHLTHDGIGEAQSLAQSQAGVVGSFYEGKNMDWPHLLEQALRAHVVFEKEKDYVVQKDEVIIVDEFTGRLMHGRQWSDGLHQAVEAKERVTVKQETQTLATITIQNFFKLYQQLAGMTGTAMTESEEFMKFYMLNVVAIPTNKPVVRDDRDDLIYRTVREKFNAIVESIFEVSKSGQPVLVGTISVEKSEAISNVLEKKYGLEHEVLNAKTGQEGREAGIVAKAGQQREGRDGKMWGNVTIATNMAGRGTDIKLAPGVTDAGGLHVLGTERHEARRIDNQLRGRSGRQGDPGSSEFFLSFQDELIQLFGGERMFKLMSMMRWPEGEAMQLKQLTKFVEKTQKKVEQRNFEARKSLLEYDEVMDYQRQVFYTRRQRILEGRALEGLLWETIDEVIAENCEVTLGRDYPYQCIADWGRNELGVDMELDRIRGRGAEELQHLMRDHAQNSEEQDITITLGEYMSEDVEPDEWDLNGLKSWAMKKCEANFSLNQLRKMSPMDVQEAMYDAVAAKLQRQDMSTLAEFLEEDFAQRRLSEWMNRKFNLKVSPEELAGKDVEQAGEYLLQQAREAYRGREIEYPVDYVIRMAMQRHQAGSGFAAQDIAGWVRYKFNQQWDVAQIQELDFEALRQKLIDCSRAYTEKGLDDEIAAAITQHRIEKDEAFAEKLADWANNRFHLKLTADEITRDDAAETIKKQAELFLREELTHLERFVLMRCYDTSWKDHLYAMDQLKSGIGLRSFAERDPRIEYKREGFRMFQEMLSGIREKVTDDIFKAQMGDEDDLRSMWNIAGTSHAQAQRFVNEGAADQEAAMANQGEARGPVKPIKLEGPKVGRNDPCPCGSGKKYKKCCGANSS